MAEDLGDRTGRVLLRASVLVRERLEELAQIEARNVGKPIRDARDEIGIVADTLEYWGARPTRSSARRYRSKIPVSTSRSANPWASARSSRRGTSPS